MLKIINCKYNFLFIDFFYSFCWFKRNISEKLTEEYQTEYKAYLQAAIKAIRKAIERNAVIITIYTDFDYLKSCIDKSIKKPKKNLQELKELDNLHSQIKVFCVI